jgi:hypothetical protein
MSGIHYDDSVKTDGDIFTDIKFNDSEISVDISESNKKEREPLQLEQSPIDVSPIKRCDNIIKLILSISMIVPSITLKIFAITTFPRCDVVAYSGVSLLPTCILLCSLIASIRINKRSSVFIGMNVMSIIFILAIFSEITSKYDMLINLKLKYIGDITICDNTSDISYIAIAYDYTFIVIGSLITSIIIVSCLIVSPKTCCG